MHEKFTALTPALHAYLVANGSRQDEVLAAVERETEALGDIAVMQIAPEQGALLELLVRAIGARRAVEVGTFTGYSAICIARGLGADGRLVCCELDPGWARTARANLQRAGVGDRAEVIVGPAAETLASLTGTEPFDFAFIDADKPGYPGYYERCLELLRPGGLLALDNVLLGGRAADPPPGDESARAIAALNERIAADERVDLAMLGVADGVTLARKR